MKKIIILVVVFALVIGGIVGYWSGYTSRHISPVEENKFRPTIAEGGVAEDTKDYFDSLTDQQKSCLKESLGESVYDEISTLKRAWPSDDEFEEIKSCTELEVWPPGGFASLEHGYSDSTWEPSWEVNN